MVWYVQRFATKSDVMWVWCMPCFCGMRNFLIKSYVMRVQYFVIKSDVVWMWCVPRFCDMWNFLIKSDVMRVRYVQHFLTKSDVMWVWCVQRFCGVRNFLTKSYAIPTIWLKETWMQISQQARVIRDQYKTERRWVLDAQQQSGYKGSWGVVPPEHDNWNDPAHKYTWKLCYCVGRKHGYVQLRSDVEHSGGNCFKQHHDEQNTRHVQFQMGVERTHFDRTTFWFEIWLCIQMIGEVV